MTRGTLEACFVGGLEFKRKLRLLDLFSRNTDAALFFLLSAAVQAIAVEDAVWIRLFNVLYRRHKSWMRQGGQPPTWDRDKVCLNQV